MSHRSNPRQIARKQSVTSRTGRKDFAAFVRRAPTSEAALPLTHVTDAYMFRDIMEQEALLPTPCDIFKGELLYLFYGRPAYRAASEIGSTGLDSYWPICFVMQPESWTPRRVYPFDSGAFHHQLFAEFMYRRMIKEDFELEADPDTPGQLLRLFWNDEQSYFQNEGLRDVVPDAMDFEVKSYMELLRYRGNGPFDERSSSIEIQVDAPMALKGNTLAVILPGEFAKPDMVARIDALGALALAFHPIRRHNASDMVSEIYRIVRDLLGGKHGRGQCW